MAAPTMFERMLAIKGKHITAGQINFADSVSRTSQEFLDETNINTIVKRYATRGIPPMGTTKAPLYGDFSTVGDYMDAQQRFLTAREQFNTLPARLRAQLHNNPAEFLAWIADPANKAQAESLGLIDQATTPVAATPAPPPAQPQAASPSGNTPS